MFKLCCQLAACSTLVIAVGCQPRGEYEALHRELFLKESKIYELQSDIDQYRRVLDSCRRANLALEADLEGNSDDQGLSGPRTAPKNRGGGATGRQPTPFLPVPGVPEVELPPDAESLPDVELPPEIDTNPSGPPPLFEGSYSRPHPAVQQAVEASVDVQRIQLNKLLTGGYNMDGHPGDEGLLVVIEPRNGQDEIIAAAGEVSIVLLDEEAAGEQKRFARWDFDAGEAQSRWRESPLGKGLHFELPWPADPPTHQQMHIFVRLTTADGRKLSADKAIKIELLDGAIAVGLQRSIDRGITHLTQPVASEPRDADAPPRLHSVLADTAEPIEANAAPEPARDAPQPTEVKSVAAAGPQAEPEVGPPPREAQQRPVWQPFR